MVDDHPARAVAAVDVEHDEQVVVGAADRALELGDVIGPDLVRPGRDELWDRARGMGRLAAALTDLAVGPQERYMVDCEAK